MAKIEKQLFDGRRFSGFLFDMDGTVLDSMAVVDRVWGRWAQEHGLDPTDFLPTIHGVRAVDTIQRLGLYGVDAPAEATKIAAAELADLEGVAAIEGASQFLTSLPISCWAIVTSAPRQLALRRLEAAGLPVPAVLVAAEDVGSGKPDPACYQLAAARLGFSVTDCLVFEDAAAGVQAAQAAGSALVVITAAHRPLMRLPHCSVKDFTALRAIRHTNGQIGLLHFTNT